MRHQQVGGPASCAQYSTSIGYAQLTLQPINRTCDVAGRARSGSDLGLPRHPENAPPAVSVSLQDSRPPRNHLHIVCGVWGSCATSTPPQDVVAPDDECAARRCRGFHALEADGFDAGKAFGGVRRLELPLESELDHRSECGDVGLRDGPQLVRHEQASVTSDDPRGGVDLRVFDRRGEPDRANRQADSLRGGNHGCARFSRHVGVVENNRRVAGLDRPLERRNQRLERAASLVAIQTVIAIGNVAPGQRALSGAGNAHDEDNVTARGHRYDAARRSGADDSAVREPLVELAAIGVGQLDAAGARDRCDVLEPARSGNRNDERREVGEPRQRNLTRGRVVMVSDAAQHGIGGHTVATLRPAQWSIRQDRDVVRQAVLDDTAGHRRVVADAERDLHRVDRDDAAGLLDLADGDVAQADAFDQAVAFERGKRPDARGQRRSRVGCMQLVEREPIDAERTTTGAGRFREMTAAAVGDPLPIGPAQPALRGNDDDRSIAMPCGDRFGNQPLVIAGLGVVMAVGVGGVEQRDSAGERRVQRRDRGGPVAIGRGRETHAAHRARAGVSGRPHQGECIVCDFGAAALVPCPPPSALCPSLPLPLRPLPSALCPLPLFPRPCL